MDKSEKIELDLLTQRAVSMWGAERAEMIRPAIQAMAAAIIHIHGNLPDMEKEPVFYENSGPT